MITPIGKPKASELLLASAEPFDQACMQVMEMETQIVMLTEALELAEFHLKCYRGEIALDPKRPNDLKSTDDVLAVVSAALGKDK